MRKNYRHSQETKEKIRKSATGRILSEETKRKISVANLGRLAWNKGTKRWWNSPSDFQPGQNKGENHPRWKGGNSREYKTGYYSKEYRGWRMSVFLRDNFTCRNCGVKNCYLTAHHIKSFAHFPVLRFDLNNGLTLCEKCHSETDNYGGRARNVYKLNGANSVEIPTTISG